MDTQADSHSTISHAPAAWRGQPRRQPQFSLTSAVAKEVHDHPLQTLMFVATGLAMARLAFARRRRSRTDVATGAKREMR